MNEQRNDVQQQTTIDIPEFIWKDVSEIIDILSGILDRIEEQYRSKGLIPQFQKTDLVPLSVNIGLFIEARKIRDAVRDLNMFDVNTIVGGGEV
jgi:hypothetical protein